DRGTRSPRPPSHPRLVRGEQRLGAPRPGDAGRLVGRWRVPLPGRVPGGARGRLRARPRLVEAGARCARRGGRHEQVARSL
ncbi:MAG: hypothetical protein AVDCRST_MAG20-990, partial [uncultured Acidimicrobiales bacterium]